MIGTKKILLIGTTLGRGMGYLRELSIVLLFGISQEADEVIFLLTSFDSLASVFSYGTITLLSLNFIKEKKAMFLGLRNFLHLIGLLYAGVCSIFIFFNGGGVNWGMVVPFIALLNIDYSMRLSIQQEEGEYLWTAFTNFIINLILIVCVFSFPNYYLFILILTSGLFLRNYFIRGYNSKKFNYKIINTKISNETKKLYFLSIFGSGLFYLIPIIDRFVASSYGKMAIFNYADRIMIFTAVLVNLIFIYPTIVKKSKLNYSLFNLLQDHKYIFSTSFFLSFIPITVLHFFEFNFEYYLINIIKFSSIHFLHFFTFLVLTSLIQIWIINSEFKKIIISSLILIFLRLPIMYYNEEIIGYTFFVLLVEILIILKIAFLSFEE